VLFGIYLGMIFAPNHKGMSTFGPGDKIDFLREQVLTSRNMRGSPITDFVYGGLNYQIEHHLFPYMPRNKFARAQKIVRDFCKAKGISYHETSVLGGIYEIFSHLNQISRYARTVA
jgi:fatty acid desaturase